MAKSYQEFLANVKKNRDSGMSGNASQSGGLSGYELYKSNVLKRRFESDFSDWQVKKNNYFSGGVVNTNLEKEIGEEKNRLQSQYKKYANQWGYSSAPGISDVFDNYDKYIASRNYNDFIKGLKDYSTNGANFHKSTMGLFNGTQPNYKIENTTPTAATMMVSSPVYKSVFGNDSEERWRESSNVPQVIPFVDDAKATREKLATDRDDLLQTYNMYKDTWKSMGLTDEVATNIEAILSDDTATTFDGYLDMAENYDAYTEYFRLMNLDTDEAKKELENKKHDRDLIKDYSASKQVLFEPRPETLSIDPKYQSWKNSLAEKYGWDMDNLYDSAAGDIAQMSRDIRLAEIYQTQYDVENKANTAKSDDADMYNRKVEIGRTALESEDSYYSDKWDLEYMEDDEIEFVCYLLGDALYTSYKPYFDENGTGTTAAMMGSAPLGVYVDPEERMQQGGFLQIDSEINPYQSYANTELVQEYINSYDEIKNQRQAQGIYDRIKDSTFTKLNFASGLGVAQFVKGISNIFNDDDYIAPNAADYLSGMIRDDLGDDWKIGDWSVAQTLFDTGTTIGNMLPSVLTSVVLSVVTGNPTVGAVTGGTLMGASAGGNAYAEMLNLGYDKDQAAAYGVMVGVSEAALEYALGGISALGANIPLKSLTKVINGMDNALAALAINMGKSMLSEFTEEALQEIIDPYLKRIAGMSEQDIEKIDWAQVFYSGILGALTAGVFEGPNVASSTININSVGRGIKNSSEAMMQLKNLGGMLNLDTSTVDVINNLDDKSSAYKIGNAYLDISNMLSNEVKEVTTSLIKSGVSKSDARAVVDALNSMMQGEELSNKQIKLLNSYKKSHTEVEQILDLIGQYSSVTALTGISRASMQGDKLSKVDEKHTAKSKKALEKAENALVKAYPELAKVKEESNKEDSGTTFEDVLKADSRYSTDTSYKKLVDEYASASDYYGKAKYLEEFRKNGNDALKEALKSDEQLQEEATAEAKSGAVELKVSDKGVDTLMSTGEAVTIVDVVRVGNSKNLKLKVQTKSGKYRYTNIDDVAYSDNNKADAFSVLRNLPVSEKYMMPLVNLVDSSSKVAPVLQMQSLAEAFSYGEVGATVENVKRYSIAKYLTDAQLKSAVKYGRINAKRSTNNAQSKIDAKKKMALEEFRADLKYNKNKGKQGKLRHDFSEAEIKGWKKTDPDKYLSFKTAEGLSQLLSVDIQLIDSNQKEWKHFKQNKADGAYVNGTVYLDINANWRNKENTMLEVLSHELVHYIKEWSPAKFKVLSDFVISEFMANDVKLDTLVENELIQMKKLDDYKGMTERELRSIAFEEIVANACERMLTDSKVVEKLSELRKKDKGLVNKLKQFIKDFFNKIRSRYAKMNPHSDEAKAVKNIVGMSEKLQKLFEDALLDATENNRIAGAQKNTAHSGVTKYSYAGAKANNSTSLFLEAERMSENGIDNETIRQKTGWFKGYDGMWRFEIDDSSFEFHFDGLSDNSDYLLYEKLYSKFVNEEITEKEFRKLKAFRRAGINKGVVPASLSDVVVHERLFEAYPQLKDVKFYFGNLNEGEHGFFSPDENTIVLSYKLIGNESQIKKTLIHEIQHAIQNIEGFANGASIEYWETQRQEIVDTISGARANLDLWLEDIGYPDFVKSSMQDVVNKKKTLEQHWKDCQEFKDNSEYAKQIANCEAELAEFQRQYDEITHGMTSYEQYHNTAGEIEARDVTSRLDMTEEQRKNTRPDIDRTDVVFADVTLSMDYLIEDETLFNPNKLSFDSIIKDVLKTAKAQDSRYVYLGRFPDEIVKRIKAHYDFKELPVVMNYRDAYLTIESKEKGRFTAKGVNYHNLGEKGFSKLKKDFANPDYVIKHKASDKLELIYPQKDYKNRRIYCIVILNTDAKYSKEKIDVHVMTTAYGKSKIDKYVETAATEGRLIYSKEESLISDSYVRYEGYAKSDSSSINRIARNVDDVNNKSFSFKTDEEFLSEFESEYTSDKQDGGVSSGTQNGLPEGVIKYHRRTDEAMSDAEVLAQHLEENSEAVGEILRRSSEIDMNERTMTRLISKRLREYGMYGSVLKETSENISLLLEAAKHPSVQGKDITADLTNVIKSALERTSYDFNPNKEDYDEVVQILKDYGDARVYLTADQEAHVREQGYDMRWLRQRYFGKLNVVKKTQFSDMNEIRLDDVYSDLSERFPNVFPTEDSPSRRAVDSSEYAMDILDKLDYLSRGQSLTIEEAFGDDAQTVATRIMSEVVADVVQTKYNSRKNPYVDSVIEKQRQLNNKRTKERVAKERQKKRDALQRQAKEFTQRNREAAQKAKERHAKTMLRHSIVKKFGELSKLLLKGTKDKNIKLGLQKAVAESLSAINMDTVGVENRIKKIDELIAKTTDNAKLKKLYERRRNVANMGFNVQQRIDALQRAYEEYSNSTENNAQNIYDEVISGHIKETKRLVGDTPLIEMSVAQLEAVNDMYIAVLHTIKYSDKVWVQDKQRAVEEVTTLVRSELNRNMKVKSDHIAMLEKSKRFGYGMLKPYYAFENIGSKTFRDLFWDLQKGELVFARDVDDAKNFIRDARKKHNWREWDHKASEAFKLSNGNEIQLSLDQIIFIYNAWKREQYREHIENGGFVFESGQAFRKTTKKGRKSVLEYVHSANDVYRMNAIDIANITSKLTEEQRAYADELEVYLSTIMSEKGNEVSRVLYGIDLYKEKHYTPIESAKGYVIKVNTPVGEYTLKNMSASKSTLPNAKNPVVLRSYEDVWIDHVNQMSMYHGLVIPIDSFNKIMNTSNYLNLKVDESPWSLRDTIEAVHGKAAVEYFNEFIRDLNGSVTASIDYTLAGKLFSTAKKVAVAASLSTVVQQPTAIIRAMAEIDPKFFFIPNNTDGKRVNHFEEIKKYSEVAILKDMGGFDAGGNRSAKDYINGTHTIMGHVDNAVMWGAQKADELGWSSIWVAVINERQAKERKKLRDLKGQEREDFLKRCGKRFNEVIVKTQVYDSVFSRNAIMRSKNELSKMLTSFMGEPTTSLNMLYSAIVQQHRNNITGGKAVRTVFAVYGSILAASVVASFVSAMRDDDKEKSFLEKWAYQFGGKLTDELNPLNMMPFVRDIMSIFQGYSVKRPDMDMIDSLWKSIQALGSDDKNAWEKFSGVAGSVANVFGIPLKNVLRDGKGFINLFDDIFIDDNIADAENINDSFRRGLTWKDHKKKTEETRGDLHKYLAAGRTDKAQELRDSYVDDHGNYDDSAYHSAVRLMLRENDPRIEQAARAMLNGNAEKKARLAQEIYNSYPKNFVYQQDVMEAIKSEAAEIEKKENSKYEPPETVEKPIYKQSFYTTYDVNRAFEDGEKASANIFIADIISAKTDEYMVTEDMTKKEAEKEAKSYVREQLTSYWKPLYLKAYAEGNYSEMNRIKDIIKYSGMYSDWSRAIKGWEKELD